MILCEGVLVYLDPETIETLFAELRSIATPGTRFAFSASTEAQSEAGGSGERASGRPWRRRASRCAARSTASSWLSCSSAPGGGWRSSPTPRAALVAGQTPDFREPARKVQLPQLVFGDRALAVFGEMAEQIAALFLELGVVLRGRDQTL